MSDDQLRPEGDGDNADERYRLWLIRGPAAEPHDSGDVELPKDLNGALDDRQRRALGEWCRELATADLGGVGGDDDDVLRVGVTRFDGQETPTLHPDDVQQMESDLRDAQYMQRLSVNAIVGSNVRSLRLMRTIAKQGRRDKTPSKQHIERRRVRLAQARW